MGTKTLNLKMISKGKFDVWEYLGHSFHSWNVAGVIKT